MPRGLPYEDRKICQSISKVRKENLKKRGTGLEGISNRKASRKPCKAGQPSLRDPALVLSHLSCLSGRWPQPRPQLPRGGHIMMAATSALSGSPTAKHVSLPGGLQPWARTGYVGPHGGESPVSVSHLRLPQLPRPTRWPRVFIPALPRASPRHEDKQGSISSRGNPVHHVGVVGPPAGLEGCAGGRPGSPLGKQLGPWEQREQLRDRSPLPPPAGLTLEEKASPLSQGI